MANKIAPVSTRLTDAQAERVRRNQEQRVSQVQAELDGLKAQVASLWPRWQTVERKVVESPTQTVTFMGLDGDLDFEYRLHCYIRDGASGAGYFALRPNGVAVSARSTHIGTTASDASPVTTSVTTEAVIAMGNTTATGLTLIDGVLYCQTGVVRGWMGQSRAVGAAAGSDRIDIFQVRLTDTTTNYTSLAVVAPNANGIGAKSQLTLMRRAR